MNWSDRTIDLSNVDLSMYLHADERRKIVPAFLLANQVKDYFYGPDNERGAYLPWIKTHQDIRLRSHEVSLWAGVNKHGKSILLSQVMLGCMQQNEKVCIASMEMEMAKTMGRMTRQAVGTNQPSNEYIEKFHEWTEDRLWLYDEVNSIRAETILALIRYCRQEIGIQHFVVDSLMKCGMGEDDYNKQKWFVNEICSIAKGTGIHIHLVAHSRKRQTETEMMDKFDVKGTGTITDMVDNIFTVWRNKPKEREAKKFEPNPKKLEEADAIINCDGQRHGEWEGMIGLWFDQASLQYRGDEYGRAVSLFEAKTLDNGSM